MRVVFGTVELADGSSVHVADESYSSQRAVQKTPLLRADYQAIFGRGNRINIVGFSVTRIFDTHAEAKEFVLTHEIDLPEKDTLSFEWSDRNQSATAALDSISMQRTGVRVEATYLFAAGKFIAVSTGLALDEVPDPDTVPDPDAIPS